MADHDCHAKPFFTCLVGECFIALENSVENSCVLQPCNSTNGTKIVMVSKISSSALLESPHSQGNHAKPQREILARCLLMVGERYGDDWISPDCVPSLHEDAELDKEFITTHQEVWNCLTFPSLHCFGGK